jgi:hypothetical protein
MDVSAFMLHLLGKTERRKDIEDIENRSMKWKKDGVNEERLTTLERQINRKIEWQIEKG